MMPVSIITDSHERARPLAEHLAGVFATELLERRTISQAKPGLHAIVDIDLKNPTQLGELRRWVQRHSKDGKVVFVVDHGDRLQAVQASALGATDLVTRPVQKSALLSKLLGQSQSLAAIGVSSEHSASVSAAIGALQNVFTAACLGAPLDPGELTSAGEADVSQIETDGLVRWIEIVRKHHSQTYQHCLLVTGVAVGYGRQLGFSAADRQRLAFAGLLHDIGKAKIPLAILEKPGPLDTGEDEV